MPERTIRYQVHALRALLHPRKTGRPKLYPREDLRILREARALYQQGRNTLEVVNLLSGNFLEVDGASVAVATAQGLDQLGFTPAAAIAAEAMKDIRGALVALVEAVQQTERIARLETEVAQLRAALGTAAPPPVPEPPPKRGPGRPRKQPVEPRKDETLPLTPTQIPTGLKKALAKLRGKDRRRMERALGVRN